MIFTITLLWALIWSFIFLLIVTCLFLICWIIYDCNQHVKEMKARNREMLQTLDGALLKARNQTDEILKAYREKHERRR